MVTCRDLSTKASDYLDGELQWWTRLEIRLHVFLCEHCRRYLQQLRVMLDALGRLGRDDDSDRADEEAAVRLARLRRTDDHIS